MYLTDRSRSDEERGAVDGTTAVGEETGPECVNALRPRGGVPCVFDSVR